MQEIQVDIVSAEQAIFSGKVSALIVMGAVGELGIFPGHTPLLTPLKPGDLRLLKGETQDIYYVSGGTMEVQPHLVTILADTVVRADELDEVAATEAKERAEANLRDKKEDFDYALAVAELAQAVAQLRAIQKIRSK